MSSREAFEKYVEEGEYLALDRDPSGEYCDRETQSAWEAWQAATERAAELCKGEMLVGSDPWHAAHTCRDAIREGNDG